MARNYDTDDIVEVKNREKRNRRLVKLIILLIIAAIAYKIYDERDKWYSKLQGIGEKYTLVVNDGKLAEGNFPIEIFGESDYYLEYSGETLFLMSDAYLYLYNVNGGLEDSRQHAYSNAIMQVSNKRALIYESGGERLRIDGDRKLLWSVSMEHPIIFARISPDGYVAVITVSDKYPCGLTVYNEKGRLVYERECVERISDLCFTDESQGAMVSFVTESGGNLVTEYETISFKSDAVGMKSQPLDSYCVVSNIYDSGAVIIGDTGFAYFNESGEIISKYSYDSKLAGCDSFGESVAVILKNDARRKYTLILKENSMSEPVVISSGEEFRHVLIYDGLVYAMSPTKIESYDFSGKLRSTVEISDSYSRFRRSGRYIFLENYRRVDRIDYES